VLGAIVLVLGVGMLVLWAAGPSAPSPAAAVAGPAPQADAAATPASAAQPPDRPKNDDATPAEPAVGPTFTLKLGEGFRFATAKVTRGKEDADFTFRYVPAQLGGGSLWYNPTTGKMDLRQEAQIPSDTPTLSATRHIQGFDPRPDPARVTTGDVATWGTMAHFLPNNRYFIVNAGETNYLLQVRAFDARGGGHHDGWHVTLAYVRVDLPLGQAGQTPAPAMAGTITFHDFFRSKQIVDVSLADGKVNPRLDGLWPERYPDGETIYVDLSGAITIADSQGKRVGIIRRNDRPTKPRRSPDGSKIALQVEYYKTMESIGITFTSPAATPAVAVVDRTGKELAMFKSRSDPAWLPDGRLVCVRVGEELNDRSDICVIDRDLTSESVIDDGGALKHLDGAPAASPDGRQLAFSMAGRVWLMNLDGSDLRQPLVAGERQQAPCFSPDGRRLALIYGEYGAAGQAQVVILDPQTGAATPYRTASGDACNPSYDTALSWTP
jgi:hypothetical protein